MIPDAALLSRLLYEAREQVDMWAEVVEIQTGRVPTAARRIVREIDEYRAERGWNRHGFGGER